MAKEEIKSFTDLLHEVQAQGLCGACGGCVSFCSAGELNALRFGSDGFPEYADRSLSENTPATCQPCLATSARQSSSCRFTPAASPARSRLILV